MTDRDPHHFTGIPANLQASPGARKEARRRLRPPRSTSSSRSYVELHALSAFSFLDGCSSPEDLVAEAARCGLPALAVTDRNGVYAAPRLWRAARDAGIKALVGAEIVLGDRSERIPSRSTRREASRRGAEADRLTVLVGSQKGYRNLCRLLTAAARGRPKADARATLEMIEDHAEGLHCLSGGSEGLFARTLHRDGPEAARRALERLRAVFPGRLHVELQRHRLHQEAARERVLIDFAEKLRLPLLATNGVRYARRDDAPLHDVLTALRHHTTLDEAGRRLDATVERHLKDARAMQSLFPDRPEALAETLVLAERLDFTLADLGYRFPDYPLPPGESPSSYLRAITWNAAPARFDPYTDRVRHQIERELDLIEKLDLAGYFLIVWDIIRFCARRGILAQGRGSAANSAVCYALAITAVDPVKMELLFERFLSEERGEWPDIDLDLPSGDRREEVIQYVYQRYGGHGAAMTANVITWRDRLATREVGKVLGFSNDLIEPLAKRLGRFHYDVSRGDDRRLEEEFVAATGLDPSTPRARWFLHLWPRIQHLPRHLGQHSGGMVIAAGRLDEVVPLEPASMPNRVVVQWDKDDCADLGIIKVDLLGLGMLNVLETAVPMIRRHEGRHVDLSRLPTDDPLVYGMLQRADTVGVFQVESRAQMASLPRNRPERFYDLVIQVAIIRPGPIVGGMVHPYFDRRRGREIVRYPHPSLEPILKRTLGVPLFQEQLLRLAMVAAGFTGGEAEELRRAMGFKRSVERMEAIEKRLRSGMAERGIVGEAQDQIVQSITSFALYGFPESHAASFALIAYASAYLKAHHPTAFLVALLNAWPMGFYHPASLMQDARRHGVRLRPIDVRRSDWLCTWENPGDDPETAWDLDRATARPFAPGAARVGLRYVKGLHQEVGEAIVAERRRRPFDDLDDFALRCRLCGEDLERLADAGALAGFGLTRREAQWQVARLGRPAGPLFEGEKGRSGSPLPELSSFEESVLDFTTTSLTCGPHPVLWFRERLNTHGVLTCAELARMPAGSTIRFAGCVIVRQRPGTAKGILFVTLEDETGMAQALVKPDQLAEHRDLLSDAPGLVIEGVIQRKDGSMSIDSRAFWSLEELAAREKALPALASPRPGTPTSEKSEGYCPISGTELPPLPSHDWH